MDETAETKENGAVPPTPAALIEALLFVSKEPLEPARLMEFLEIRDIDAFEALLASTEALLQGDSQRGLLLKRAGGGLQLVTKPELHDHLKDFFTIRHSAKLTLASLETMSIVAYRQPITLAEIADMRGVNSSGPVKSLLQKKLLRIVGRKKVPGLPALYATTPEFLVYFGLNDLTELPTLDELTELFEEKEQPSLFKK
jgi:segregation and condensation protein B